MFLILVSVFIRSASVRGIFWKFWATLQWVIFSFAAVGMFAVSLVRYYKFKVHCLQPVQPHLSIKRIKSGLPFLIWVLNCFVENRCY